MAQITFHVGIVPFSRLGEFYTNLGSAQMLRRRAHSNKYQISQLMFSLKNKKNSLECRYYHFLSEALEVHVMIKPVLTFPLEDVFTLLLFIVSRQMKINAQGFLYMYKTDN